MGKAVYLTTLAVIALSAAIAGWLMFARAPQAPDQPAQAEQVESFVAAGCWQCHQVGAYQQQVDAALGGTAGAQTGFGPDLSGIGGLYPDAWHAAHLYDPATVVAGSQMPRQSHLFEAGTTTLNAQGRDVIGFLQSLRVAGRYRQPLPQGSHTTALVPDTARGKVLFQTHCAGCHGPQGRGDGPAAVFFGVVKPANLAAGDIKRKAGAAPTINDLFTTLTKGIPSTGMPSFHPLPPQDRADLAGYALALKQ